MYLFIMKGLEFYQNDPNYNLRIYAYALVRLKETSIIVNKGIVRAEERKALQSSVQQWLSSIYNVYISISYRLYADKARTWFINIFLCSLLDSTENILCFLRRRLEAEL